MKHLRFELCLQNRRVLLAGDTPPIATELVRLLEAGAEVRVATDNPCAPLADLIAEHALETTGSQLELSDLQGLALVVSAATETPELAELCRRSGVPLAGIDPDPGQECLPTAGPQSSSHPDSGVVWLVGAGPGDPELLTCKARRLLHEADIVVYDRLVSRQLLRQASKHADFVYVGKSTDRHTLPQEDINSLLVRLARQGKKVLRLKGGDPFMFGRGGEEIETLKAAGVSFQVVPGITAALGCAATAGIPLTHRDHAQACLFVTGHLQDGSLELPWQAMVQPHQTVVVYMGLGALPQLSRRLMDHGLTPDWPAALIEQGTTERQRVITATLATLPLHAKIAGLKPPTLVILGETVKLRAKLGWVAEQPSQLPARLVAV